MASRLHAGLYQSQSNDPPTVDFGMFPPDITSISSRFNSCMPVTPFYR